MKLTIDQFAQLQSAGFTDRQITTMQEKFYCLLETVPLPDPVHVQNIESLSQQLAEQAEAIDLQLHTNRRIVELEQRLATMTKERDKAKAMPMKYRRMEFNAQLQDEAESLRQQLVDYQTKHDVACSTINMLQKKCDVRGRALSLQCKETKDLRQKLTNSQKREVMLHGALKDAHEFIGDDVESYETAKRRIEALSATDDLDGLILCHAESVARKISYGSLVFLKGYAELPEGTPLYRAWGKK